jgi:hypothetical protein
MWRSTIREKKEMSSPKCGTLKTGTVVKVLEECEVEGGKLRIRTKTGWMSEISSAGVRLLEREACIVVQIADIKCFLKNFKFKVSLPLASESSWLAGDLELASLCSYACRVHNPGRAALPTMWAAPVRSRTHRQLTGWRLLWRPLQTRSTKHPSHR